MPYPWPAHEFIESKTVKKDFDREWKSWGYFRNLFWEAVTFTVFTIEAFWCTFYVTLPDSCEHSQHKFGWRWTALLFEPYSIPTWDNKRTILCKVNKVTCYSWKLFDFETIFRALKLWCQGHIQSIVHTN